MKKLILTLLLLISINSYAVDYSKYENIKVVYLGRETGNTNQTNNTLELIEEMENIEVIEILCNGKSYTYFYAIIGKIKSNK